MHGSSLSSLWLWSGFEIFHKEKGAIEDEMVGWHH